MQLPDFALRVHSSDGVAAACVLLQDRFELDVNLLLFAARVGTVGALTLPTLAAAAERVGQWHSEVVRPLRAVRRRLKTGPPPAPDTQTAPLREEVQALEIRAELIELHELDALVPYADATDDDPVARVIAALTLAVRARSARAFADDEAAALATIAAAALDVAGD